MPTLLETLQNGLIVSCQAQPHSPVYGARFMAAFARCAELGGAVAIRANGARDVRAVRKAVRLPIIGINKRRDPRYSVYITPTFASARQVVRAGAEIVALDATHRPRQGGAPPERLIKRIREELGVLVMADIDTVEEALAAEAAGADMIATTLAGYTAERERTTGADLALVRELSARLRIPVICEGRLATPEDVHAAFEAGAYAVVVGTAITNPIAITQRFVATLPKRT
ncbi:MAG: N-acetylmannosamine-6-phosphate 2-epimerase [Candidatus Thermofonsia Clade 1 bacterium]|uniref:Putative N-acetylmannosamine-6-phosphate 2-epimerase n=1 Tax=Candidatus Thermofonsia Clade 1 bacterium TaxID=2364210 RepID=A0A2M8NYQ6_9CHLR|nr:MAG: N-acetylmannosamine-6-phosphate 2-epimerase [Candidatus Thermofonsia Clade 1 bacterium]